MLTPLAIDPAHPFPQLLNKSLNLIVRLEMPQAPARCSSTWRWCKSRASCRAWSSCRARTARQDYVYLDRLIGHYLADLFPGTTLLGYWPFRVTRNSELYIDEEETANLLKAVENELHNRRKGDAVRLEIDHECPPLDARAAAQDAAADRGRPLPHRRPAEPHAADGADRGRPFARAARPAVRGAGGRAPARSGPTCLPPSASGTSCCTIPTRASTAWWSSWSWRRRTRTCWPSSRRFTAPAATGASSARWRTRSGTASR